MVAAEEKKRESCVSQPRLTSFFKPAQEKKFDANHIKQRSMTKKLLESITCDQLPRSIRAKLIESQLMTEFEHLSRIYLTLDLWTNRRMVSFLAVTVQFINSSWELKSRVIACIQFVERHIAVNIATAYEEIVMKFGIRGKVRRVVANNASSMVRAFDVCLPGLYGDEVRSEGSGENENEDALDILEEELDLDEVLALLPPERSSCFVHTQQLCIRDAFNDPSVRNSAVATVIHKCYSIVAAIRRSTVAAPFLKKIGVALQAAKSQKAAQTSSINLYSIYRASPINLCSIYRTSPINLCSIYRTSPINLCSIYRTSPINLCSIYRTIPVNLCSIYRTSPINLCSIYRTSPINLCSFCKTSPINLCCIHRTNTIILCRTYRTSPINLCSIYRTIPVNLCRIYRTTPITLCSIYRTSPTNLCSICKRSQQP
ncbi:AC9 transposase-like 5 [Homarus americanus]|uniref:AC9 transposase-like 5 n=1 Tax=Homarus americanus TaxID=6706 RepID=A0A8J5MQA1_HOMAM|nr:AC9 transposase-like 5 [Homarus americanus]